MDTKELYIALSKYKYLKDITGYSQQYQDKYLEGIVTVLGVILSDLIEDEIDNS